MQSFMLSSKSAQFLEYVDLRTRTIANRRHFMIQRKIIANILYS